MSIVKFYNWDDFDINWENEGYHWQHAVFIRVTAVVKVDNVVITQVSEDKTDSHTTAENFVFVIDDQGNITSPTPPPVLNIVIDAATTGSNIELVVTGMEFVTNDENITVPEVVPTPLAINIVKGITQNITLVVSNENFS